MKEIIDSFGGEVFPKLNWKSPKDAMWMTTSNSLKCHSPSDVMLLLKTSERLLDDLESIRTSKENSEMSISLGLREWRNVPSAGEFRCFVHNGELIGVSQRGVTEYFPSVVEDRKRIRQRIDNFFETVLQSSAPLSSCKSTFS